MYDTPENVNRFKDFIVAELQNNEFEMNAATKVYCLDIDNDKIVYLDRISFVQQENTYIRSNFGVNFKTN